jgi:hypothetical protein
MAIKTRPCAYCGTTLIPRERGHVIPRCLYPSGGDQRIQRRTVAECQECKKLWQDAENHFRNVMVITSPLNPAATEQWEGPIRRSFEMPSGSKWRHNLTAKMVPIDPATNQYILYPYRDPDVMLVVRKIIRGLCDYHGLATAVCDDRVWVAVLRYAIQPDLLDRLERFHVGREFFEYGFDRTNDLPRNIESAWYLKFFGAREFVGIVHLS